MKRILVFAAIVVVTALSQAANLENPEPEIIAVTEILERMVWADRVTDPEMDFVTNKLFSSSYTLVSQAVVTGIATGNPRFWRAVESGSTNDFRRARCFAHNVAEMAMDSSRTRAGIISVLKSENIRRKLRNGRRFVPPTIVERFSIPLASRIAAVLIAKELRSNNRIVFDPKEYSFSRFDELLIEYSRLDRRTAITTIQEKLADETTPDIDKRELRRVLKTYHPDERNHDQPTVGMERKPDR